MDNMEYDWSGCIRSWSRCTVYYHQMWPHGLIATVLDPAGDIGKFLLVPALCSWLSLAQNHYTVLVAMISKSFLVIYWSEISTAAYVKLPHIRNFYRTTRSFISSSIVQFIYHNPSLNPDVIGYWTTIFAVIVLTGFRQERLY
jgi:hypothetical protein